MHYKRKCYKSRALTLLFPCHEANSEQVGLLHDAQELLLIHFTVSITIRFIYHFLQLFIRHALAKLLCYTLEVLKRDLSSLVVVEQAESLQDLVFRIAIQY